MQHGKIAIQRAQTANTICSLSRARLFTVQYVTDVDLHQCDNNLIATCNAVD